MDWFIVYATGSLSIFIFGLSKSGFGSGFGVIAVPLFALVAPINTVVATLLPVLLVADAVSLRAYWGTWQWRDLLPIIPAGFIGIMLGWLVFGFINPQHVRLLIGLITLSFCAWQLLSYVLKLSEIAFLKSRMFAWLASLASGFTSTIAHAGAPPISIYLLAKRFGKMDFLALSVAYFAFLNLVKLVPYWHLGFFNSANLSLSLMMAPFAVLGAYAGLHLRDKIPTRPFFWLIYGGLIVTGLKLTFDGLTG